LQGIDLVSQAIDQENLEEIKEVVPVHNFPDELKRTFMSENETTFMLNVNLKEGLERSDTNRMIKKINQIATDEIQDYENIQLKITGPSGIVSDMISIFASADLVLLLATIALIFIILIIFYDSPIIAFDLLIVVVIIYEIVDRTIVF